MKPRRFFLPLSLALWSIEERLRSLALNPQNTNATRMLKKLEGAKQ